MKVACESKGYLTLKIGDPEAYAESVPTNRLCSDIQGMVVLISCDLVEELEFALVVLEYMLVRYEKVFNKAHPHDVDLPDIKQLVNRLI